MHLLVLLGQLVVLEDIGHLLGLSGRLLLRCWLLCLLRVHLLLGLLGELVLLLLLHLIVLKVLEALSGDRAAYKLLVSSHVLQQCLVVHLLERQLLDGSLHRLLLDLLRVVLLAIWLSLHRALGGLVELSHLLLLLELGLRLGSNHSDLLLSRLIGRLALGHVLL